MWISIIKICITTLKTCHVLLCPISTYWYSKSRIRPPKSKYYFYNTFSCVWPNWTLYCAHRYTFNENKQYRLCETTTNLIVNKKLYARKNIVIMDTSILEFHQNVYIPAIQKLSLHLTYVHFLGTNYCRNSHQETSNSRAVYRNVLCVEIMQRIEYLVLHNKSNLNTMVVIYLFLLKTLHWNIPVLQIK